MRSSIPARIDTLASDPRLMGALKLAGQKVYRLRVGDYRVVYTTDDEMQVATVVRVAYRREVYR